MMKTILAAALLFVSCAALAETADEARLRQLNADLQTATWKGDAAWMREHLSSDFVLINTRGNIVNLEDWIKSIKDSRLEPFEPAEVTIRVFGNSAIVSARIVMKYAAEKERVAIDLRYTDVWIKGADGWKYVAAHASPISVTKTPLTIPGRD